MRDETDCRGLIGKKNNNHKTTVHEAYGYTAFGLLLMPSRRGVVCVFRACQILIRSTDTNPSLGEFQLQLRIEPKLVRSMVSFVSWNVPDNKPISSRLSDLLRIIAEVSIAFRNGYMKKKHSYFACSQRNCNLLFSYCRKWRSTLAILQGTDDNTNFHLTYSNVGKSITVYENNQF